MIRFSRNWGRLAIASKKSGGVAISRGQDLNDTTIEGFGLGSKFDCVFHPESLAPLGWGGRRKKQAVG